MGRAMTMLKEMSSSSKRYTHAQTVWILLCFFLEEEFLFWDVIICYQSWQSLQLFRLISLPVINFLFAVLRWSGNFPAAAPLHNALSCHSVLLPNCFQGCSPPQVCSGWWRGRNGCAPQSVPCVSHSSLSPPGGGTCRWRPAWRCPVCSGHHTSLLTEWKWWQISCGDEALHGPGQTGRDSSWHTGSDRSAFQSASSSERESLSTALISTTVSKSSLICTWKGVGMSTSTILKKVLTKGWNVGGVSQPKQTMAILSANLQCHGLVSRH